MSNRSGQVWAPVSSAKCNQEYKCLQHGADSDLVNASASALQDDDLQQFCSVTLGILSRIYGQHLQRVEGQKAVYLCGHSHLAVKLHAVLIFLERNL